MSDRIRYAMICLIAVAMLAAVAAAPTVAQKTDPSAEGVFEAAGINADRVDGRHAVGPGAGRWQRAGKLVAADSKGFLPNNIIRKARNADKLDGLDSSRFLQALYRYRQSGAETELAPGATQTMTLSCNAGDLAIAGGWQGSPGIVVMTSEPGEGPREWTLTFGNDWDTPQPVQPHAICLVAE
jgi:hypothetical protein